MAQIIKLRRSGVEGKVPDTGSLALGEIAINTFDGKLFIKKDDGDEAIETIVTTNADITGSINLVGTASILTVEGDIVGNNKQATGTGGEISFIKDFVTDISYEDTAFYNHDTINVFAGAHKWATKISASNVYQNDRSTHLPTGSIGNEPFEPGGNTYQPYFNNNEDDMQIYIDHTSEPIRWRGIVGVQFTSTSWRANKVIIEGYSGSGEWIEAKNTTSNDDAVVVGYFNNIFSAGIERVRITLGDPQSSNKYIRISKIFGYDYKGVSSGQDDAVATGTYYVNKFDNSAHYSNIYPASGGVDLGRNGDRYRNVYAEDLTIDDWGSVSESLASIQTAGGVNGSGASNKVAIWSDADTLTSDTNLHFDSTNDRLGIGTSTPSETLELGSGDKIKLQSGANTTGSIIFRASDSQTLFSSFNTSAGGPKQFEIKHNLGDTELINRRGELILSASTNDILINTTDPSTLDAGGGLHIRGASSPSIAITSYKGGSPALTSHIELRGYDGRAKGIEFTESGSHENKKWFIGPTYQGNNQNFSIGYDALNNRAMYKASSSFYVTSDGNVGIGETSPSAKLHISQSTTSPGLIVDGGKGGNLIAKFRRSEGVTPDADGFVGIHLSDSDAQIRFEPVTETRRWSIGASNASPGNFVFATSSKIDGNEVAYINRKGGIHATSITSSGAISASGNLFGSLSDANGSYNNTVMYDTSTGQLYYTGSYGGGGGSSVSAVLAAELSASLVSAVGGVEDGNGFDAGATLESVLRAILVQFVPPTFSSLTITGLDTYLEVGSTEQSTINGGTFVTASSTSNGTGYENNGGSFALSLAGNATNDGSISATYSGNTISFTSPSSITVKRTTAGNVVFTLAGTDQESNVTNRTDAAYFRLPIFYGGSSNNGSGADDATLDAILADISSSVSSTSGTSGLAVLSTTTSTFGQQTLINTTNSNLPSNTKITLPSSVAVASNYTYIVIPSAFGNLTSMLKNGVQDEFGTFSNGVPLFTANHERFSGVNTEYNVFRSSGQNAFATGDTLTFND
jgi:hypothetical protein